MEGASYYAQHFPIVREDDFNDFNENSSSGPHGDYLPFKKKKNPTKLKEHHMTSGI